MKKDPKKCSTRWCRNDRVPGRSLCHKCKSRRTKQINPHLYTFNLLRCNAKRRGKPFTLTLEEFKSFCDETGYMELKARNKNAMSIDRIDSSKGYSMDNIQIMRYGDNSSKQDDYPF